MPADLKIAGHEFSSEPSMQSSHPSHLSRGSSLHSFDDVCMMFELEPQLDPVESMDSSSQSPLQSQ